MASACHTAEGLQQQSADSLPHRRDPEDAAPEGKRLCVAPSEPTRLPVIASKSRNKHEIPVETINFLRQATTTMDPEAITQMLEALIQPSYFYKEVPADNFQHNVVQLTVIVNSLPNNHVDRLLRLFLRLTRTLIITQQQLDFAKRTWLPTTSLPEIPAALNQLISDLSGASDDCLRRSALLEQLRQLKPYLTAEETLFSLRLLDLRLDPGETQMALLRDVCALLASRELAAILPTVKWGSRRVVASKNIGSALSLFLTRAMPAYLQPQDREPANIDCDRAEVICAALFLLDQA